MTEETLETIILGHIAKELKDEIKIGRQVKLAKTIIQALRIHGFVEQSEQLPNVQGIELIAEERKRQIEKEGWTAEHDAEHKNGEMAIAAACYAYPNYDEDWAVQSQLQWPWEKHWWKPSGDRKRDLAKAGALIAAEIDRLNAL